MVTSFTDWDKDPNYLAHFGTKGMKWGQRRYQNQDGSLTALGKERYGSGGKASARRMTKDLNKLDRERAYTTTRLRSATNKIARKDLKYAEKIERANRIGKLRKVAKYKAKQDKLKTSRTAKKAAEYADLMKRNQTMTNKILNSASKAGLKVKTRGVTRVTNKGRAIAAATGAAALLTGAAAGSKALFGKTVREGGKTVYGMQAVPGSGNPKGINGGKSYFEWGPVMTKGGTTRTVGPLDKLNSNQKSLINAGARSAAMATQLRFEKGTHYKVKKAKRG